MVKGMTTDRDAIFRELARAEEPCPKHTNMSRRSQALDCKCRATTMVPLFPWMRVDLECTCHAQYPDQKAYGFHGHRPAHLAEVPLGDVLLSYIKLTGGAHWEDVMTPRMRDRLWAKMLDVMEKGDNPTAVAIEEVYKVWKVKDAA